MPPACSRAPSPESRPPSFFMFRCDGAGEHRQAPHPLLPRTLARVGIVRQGDVHPRRQLTLPARLDRAARRDLLKPWWWKGREGEASSVGHRQVPTNRTYSNPSSLALLWQPPPRLAPHSCRSRSLQCCRRSSPPRLPRAGG